MELGPDVYVRDVSHYGLTPTPALSHLSDAGHDGQHDGQHDGGQEASR